jgi:hypothetical protein
MKAKLETEQHDEQIIEQAYECRCGNIQTLRFWKDETPLPAACCVKCRAGFGSDMNYAAMARNGIGMLPVEPATVQ